MTPRIAVVLSAATLTIGMIGLPAFADEAQWHSVAEALGKAGTNLARS
jgi:hypothetical protein